MAQLEVSQNKIYVETFLTIAGVGAVATPANFNATSQLLSIVRTGAGGTPGVPKVRKVAPSGAGANAVWGMGVFSSSATDTSTYDVYYTNEYIPSPYLAQTGAVAGVQYSP
jgi:hypothetical protein